jgi:hypothetical protein
MLAPAVHAQCLSITSPNNTATGTIEGSPIWVPAGICPTSFTTTGSDLAYNLADIESDTAGIPTGIYLNWCIDTADGISGCDTYYSNLYLYSSCDPNIATDLPAGYPAGVYSDTILKQINYLLNNQNGAYWYDVQLAIWELLGNTQSALSAADLLQGPGYGPFGITDPNVNLIQVATLVATAQANAATWKPSCGAVTAVIVAVGNGAPVDQLTIIEVPVAPTLTPGSLGCFTTLAAAEAAALADTETELGGTTPSGVGYSTSGSCPTTITVTGNACGFPISVSYTATILTTPPVLLGLPPKTATYTSISQVPTAPTVTATNACGTEITPNYTSSQTNPNSSCDDVITRVWSVTDCAEQTTTFTETITVTNTSTQTTCGSCSFQGCNGGYLWCNAQLTCTPGQSCIVYCQNVSVTLTCRDGKSYTYPVPDCQVNFSSSCRTANCSFAGGNWCTTVPTCGDSQIFLSGCGIPWQSDFANCTGISCTGSFCCSTPGVNCQWKCAASCYNCNLSNCGSIQVKPCYQNNCGYNDNNCAGTPENCTSYCQFGNNYGNQGGNNYGNQGGNNYGNQGGNNYGNQGGNNYCGSWSNPGSFSCR